MTPPLYVLTAEKKFCLWAQAPETTVLFAFGLCTLTSIPVTEPTPVAVFSVLSKPSPTQSVGLSLSTDAKDVAPLSETRQHTRRRFSPMTPT